MSGSSTKPVRSAILACALAAAGCGGAGPDATNRATIDTVGGVVRVRNAPLANDAEDVFTLGDPVRIGGGLDAAEAESFGRVAGVTVLDGRIYIADGQSRDIRVFDREGRYLFRFGRQGEGPGEFSAIDAVAAAPDGTLLARDPRLFRVTRFDSEGRYIADYRLQRPYPQYGDASGFRIGRDGWFYDRLSLTLAIASDDSLAVIVYDDTGHTRDTVIAAQTPRRFVSVVSDGIPRGGLPIPFGPVASAAVAPDGRIARTTGSDFRFDILAAVGTPERTVELQVESPTVSAQQRDSALDAMREIALQMTDGGRLEDFAFPSKMAAITHMLADAEGYWWVGANHSASRAQPPARFEIFDARGIHLGSVAVSFLPVEIGRDYIAGISTDDLGVETVVVVPLDRRALVPD